MTTMQSTRGPNSFVVGQLAILIGCIAFALACAAEASRREEVASGDREKVNAQQDPDNRLGKKGRVLRTAAGAIAIPGLLLGAVGWYREKPPLLALTGMILCVCALCLYYAIVVICILFLVLMGVFGALWLG